MSNADAVRGFYAGAFQSAGDHERAIAHFFADDCAFHGQPEGLEGRDGFAAMVGMFRAAMSGMDVTISLLIEDGDRVGVVWSTSMTHTGELMGIAATGKPVTARGVDIYRFDDAGKAVERWQVMDMAGLAAQLTG